MTPRTEKGKTVSESSALASGSSPAPVSHKQVARVSPLLPLNKASQLWPTNPHQGATAQPCQAPTRARRAFLHSCASPAEAKKRKKSTLTRAGGLLGWSVPCTKKAADLILGQGTGLGCRFNPRSGLVWEATKGCLPLSPHFPSLSNVTEPSKKRKKTVWGK